MPFFLRCVIRREPFRWPWGRETRGGKGLVAMSHRIEAPQQLIFTADDFGLNQEINIAVIRAHREGILTSASLMAGSPAAEDAVKLARQTPTLSVGLHVVVVDGRAVLSPAEIPDLVDSSAYFPKEPVRLGFCYRFSVRAQAQLAKELRAQFERFAGFGLPLSHVDGHLHMHMHPVVLNMLLPLIAEFGPCGLRVPRDELGTSVAHNRRHLPARVTRTIAMRLLSRHCLRLLGNLPIAYTDRVYGIAESGCITEAYVLDRLQHLEVASAEFVFHPTMGPALDRLGPNPGDLTILLSPQVRREIEQRRFLLTSYPFLLRPISL